MVRDYFAGCGEHFPEHRSELRRISLALGRGGVERMEQLCAIWRTEPEALLAIRSIGEKSLGLIGRVCARYEEAGASPRTRARS